MRLLASGGSWKRKAEEMRRVPTRASSPRSVVCPACESGELRNRKTTLSRCDDCGSVLDGAWLETLRQIIGLPDSLGAHACECGHPEMRRLPDGVFHCPACGSEVLPIEVSFQLERRTQGGRMAPHQNSIANVYERNTTIRRTRDDYPIDR